MKTIDVYICKLHLVTFVDTFVIIVQNQVKLLYKID
jgi:hypothetical protein